MDNSIDLANYIKTSIADFDAAMNDWRSEAWDAYDFVAGRQYSQSDIAVLQAQARPPVTFNLIEKFLASVSGTEVNNRMVPRYYPSAASNSGPVEVVSEITHACLDDSAEEEHSDAFLDTLISGYGWVDSYLDEKDGYYKIKECRVNPFYMGWDPVAVRSNLSDARYRYYRMYMDREEVEAEWPDKAEDLDLTYTEVPQPIIADNTDDIDYARNVMTGIKDVRNQLCVIRFQYYRMRRYTVIKTPNGSEQAVLTSDLSKIKSKLESMGIVAEEVREYPKKCFYQAYFCRGIILEGPEEIPCYTLSVCTGKRDLVKGYFYGILRSVRDPQLWTNKFFSNIMHIMSSAGKGIIAEQSALIGRDVQKFETEYARPDRIKLVADGALSGGRIKPMDPTPMPAGLADLLAFASQSINNTIGINLEFLGMNYRTQSGPVERSRKQSGLTVLSKFFQSRRQQLKELGAIRWALIQDYMPQEQVFSILSDANKPYFPGVNDILFRQYYVKVDEVPTSGDVKEDVWQVIVELIPYLMNAGSQVPPQFLVELLKYSPLPAHITAALENVVNQPNPNAQMEVEKTSAAVAETKSKALLNLAKAQQSGQGNGATDAETIGEIINKLMEMQINQQKTAQQQGTMMLDSQLKSRQSGHKMAETTAKMMQDTIKHRQNLREIAAKTSERPNSG